ncbi:MAG: hypothetical protein EXR21_03835 [Flavobacteriaceae bacterium]|nr:hypothetical protein [Flavobacteriaceae bacterium]
MNYAIVDIETTGGHAAQHSIIEIAIVVTDGKQILKRYETLVDPGMDIPRHITGLTGIDDGMVAAAPMFDKIADEVYELLKDCVFVAHSVNFDLSFVKAELAACGYKFNPPKLCTVRLGRKLLPGHRSYSLGSLCSNLGIEIENRHRAMGDAEATFQVFKLLMEGDTDYTMATAMKRTTGEHKLPPNLSQDQFKALPEKAGVYYFYNGQGKIIYIGKAVNIKKRVSSHFTANLKSARRQQFMREIHSISHEIQKHWPIYNKALKRIEFHYGVFDLLATMATCVWPWTGCGRAVGPWPNMTNWMRPCNPCWPLQKPISFA